MDLSDWASIAEIIAAIGVMLSLIFVGFQIRGGTQEARAATVQAASDAEAFFIATVVNHSSTWNKVVSGEPLESGEETRRGINLYNFLIVETENRYHQYQSGYLDSQAWEARLRSMRPSVKLPIYPIWRKSYGAMGRSADFLEMLDKLADEPSVE